jgi:phenylacetate-coenzyme A ligase PaaK-like adenylate-forming protein
MTNKVFLKNINQLTNFHYENSPEYKKILNFFKFKKKNFYSLEDLPFLPARLFKEVNLKSIPNNKIFKTLLSSGTSGSKPSKIYLDKENAINQRVALSKIFKTFVSEERVPMLIINKNIKFDVHKFNAKTAAIIGFSSFAKSIHYLINENEEIDYEILQDFLNKFSNKKFLIFGFTYDVYNFVINKLKKDINFENATLLHGGGWKKLESDKISNENFKKKLNDKCKIKKIINYYGLIEQVGSIFFECPNCNVFICSDYSDILIRDKNLNILKQGKGFVQLLSLLPTSYPGHNILTEDIGEIVSENKCKCGIKGKNFKIYGRLKEAEIRGCSDV